MTDLKFTSAIADAGHPENAPVPAALTEALAGTTRLREDGETCVLPAGRDGRHCSPFGAWIPTAPPWAQQG